MASDASEVASRAKVRKKLKKNERLLSKELGAMNKDKMAALLLRTRASMAHLKRSCSLSPAEVMKESTVRRKRKAERFTEFTIDRNPELNEELLFRRQFLTDADTTEEDDTDEESVVGYVSLSGKQATAEPPAVGSSDLNLCLVVPDRRKNGPRGKDPWWVDPEDLVPPSKRTKRYYHGGDTHRCDVCDMKGHYPEHCPVGAPTCILCGKLGHRKEACPNPVCHACFENGHKETSCRLAVKRREVTCRRCGAVGHLERFCFEKWRQFHITTTANCLTPVKGKQKKNRLIYCSNCARRGHWSHECHKPPVRSQLLYAPGPSFISRYDTEPQSNKPAAAPPSREGRKETLIEEVEVSSQPEKTKKAMEMEEKIHPATEKQEEDDIQQRASSVTPRRRQDLLGSFVPLTGGRRGLKKKSKGDEEMSETRRKRKKRKKPEVRQSLHQPVPEDSDNSSEQTEEWLYNVAQGQSLTFKRRLHLLDSVSATLRNIDCSNQAGPSRSSAGRGRGRRPNGGARDRNFASETQGRALDGRGRGRRPNGGAWDRNFASETRGRASDGRGRGRRSNGGARDRNFASETQGRASAGKARGRGSAGTGRGRVPNGGARDRNFASEVRARGSSVGGDLTFKTDWSRRKEQLRRKKKIQLL